MDKKARFVHFSTDYVFGGGGHSEPIPEVAAKAPINVYGASKCMGENLAALVGCDTLILRVASLFGVAGASGKGGNFVETMLRLGKERGLLNVVNDQYMSPTATADVADATLKLIGVGAPAGIWHVVNTGAASWYDFAKQIVACSGIAAEVNPIQSSDYPTPARRPSYSVLSNSKLGSALGEIRTWKEALKDYMIAKGYG
jgi:dTDP-4-dehydrorhamnose reductase